MHSHWNLLAAFRSVLFDQREKLTNRYRALTRLPFHVKRLNEKPFEYPKVYLQWVDPTVLRNEFNVKSEYSFRPRSVPWVFPDRWMDLSLINDSMEFCTFLATNKTNLLEIRQDFVKCVSSSGQMDLRLAHFYHFYTQSLGNLMGMGVFNGFMLVTVSQMVEDVQKIGLNAVLSNLWKDFMARVTLYYGYLVSYLLVEESDPRSDAYHIVMCAIVIDIMEVLRQVAYLSYHSDKIPESQLPVPDDSLFIANALAFLKSVEEKGLDACYPYIGRSKDNHDIYETVFAKKSMDDAPMKFITREMKRSVYANAPETLPWFYEKFPSDVKSIVDFGSRIVNSYTKQKLNPISDKLSYWWDLASNALDSIEEEEKRRRHRTQERQREQAEAEKAREEWKEEMRRAQLERKERERIEREEKERREQKRLRREEIIRRMHHNIRTQEIDDMAAIESE